jgi:hypothetical protein
VSLSWKENIFLYYWLLLCPSINPCLKFLFRLNTLGLFGTIPIRRNYFINPCLHVLQNCGLYVLHKLNPIFKFGCIHHHSWKTSKALSKGTLEVVFYISPSSFSAIRIASTIACSSSLVLFQLWHLFMFILCFVYFTICCAGLRL